MGDTDMKHDNPHNRLLLNGTLALFFSPLYLVVLAPPDFGVINRLAHNIADGNAFVQPLLYVFLLGFIVSLGWLFVRGRIAGPMGLFFLLLLTYGFVSGTDKEKRYELLIGAGRPTLGIDVYCNGVHLGKTPVRISKEELYKEVKPWDRPPRQIRLDMRAAAHQGDDRYFWANYYYVPDDVFDRWNEWPPDFDRYRIGPLTEALKKIEATKYWWHFEKDGCVGLVPIANFAGGSSGSGGVTIITVSPQISFLSAELHLTAMLDELARTDYEASDEWIAHFRKYSGLLFMDFYKKAQANDKLQPTLDAIVRAEFGIPKDPTAADCARVVDEILDRVEKNGCFTAPSLESLAMDIVGKVDRRPIVKRFREHLDMAYGSGGRASSTGWTTWRRNGKAARQLPLEYAVRNLRPPELFNRLVYLSTNSDRFLDVIGNYRRAEAVRLIGHYLRQIERGKGRGYNRRHNVQDAIRLCSKIDNPELDERFYGFIRENASSNAHEHYLRQFFESRVKSKESDKSRLATFVFSGAPLDERDKIEQFCKIDSPTSLHYINYFTRFDDRQRKRALEHLTRMYNPSLDEFLIESYNWLVEKPDVKHYGNHAEVTRALVNANSDRIRKFLEGKWSESPESRGKLSKILRSSGWTKPHMAWLVPLIAQLPPDEKYEAAGILDNVNTDDAWALLEEWADGDNEKLVRQAKWFLDRHAKETKNLNPLTGKGADLIAGKIKPDDLLAGAAAYVWTDKGYVSEKEISHKSDKQSDAR